MAAYLALLWLVFAAFFLLDSVLMLLQDAKRMLQPGHFASLALVIALGMGWRLMRRGSRARGAVVGAEVGATLLVPVVAAVILRGLPRDSVSSGPLMAMALVLVVRAAIVPSRARHTLLVGGLVTATGTLAYAARAGDGVQLAAFALPWLTAFSCASSFASRVIYGLHEQVRSARQLGQYLLDEKLGEGGMGVVYRASHQLLRRPTAIKLIARARADARHTSRFDHEVRQTARLTHPNTVTVYDYGHTRDGVFYYAMELLDGATLDDIVTVGGPLSPARVVHVLSAIASALSEAHGIQLIHRDIKPGNVMLCEQAGTVDVIKVLDFGLVKDLSQSTGLTHSEALTGTPAFMAPEAIRAPQSVGPPSDLYAVGALGYFLLAGEPVFAGATVMEVCSHHLLSRPIPPSERGPRPVPAALEQLILDCLEKEPERRPPSAVALRQRLSSLDGVGTWSESDARAWWEAHRPSLDRLKQQRRGAARSQTLAVDLAGRT